VLASREQSGPSPAANGANFLHLPGLLWVIRCNDPKRKLVVQRYRYQGGMMQQLTQASPSSSWRTHTPSPSHPRMVGMAEPLQAWLSATAFKSSASRERSVRDLLVVGDVFDMSANMQLNILPGLHWFVQSSQAPPPP
jgi:hypothetical protein